MEVEGELVGADDEDVPGAAGLDLGGAGIEGVDEAGAGGVEVHGGGVGCAQALLHDPPVLILDDVFAELDSVRRARLIDLIASYEQVIITAAVREDIPAGINATMFSIRDGKVVDHDG